MCFASNNNHQHYTFPLVDGLTIDGNAAIPQLQLFFVFLLRDFLP